MATRFPVEFKLRLTNSYASITKYKSYTEFTLICVKKMITIFTILQVNVSPEGATFDFVIGASYKARIACKGNPETGLVHTLSIDGNIVPEAE